MKSGVYILDHDTGFKNMKKELVNKYGEEETSKIWAKAGGLRMAKLFTSISKIPDVKYLMLPIFAKVQKSFFGEAAEFESVSL